MSLRFTILGVLSMRPMTGYDLKRTFDSSVRHFWSADQAAIYRALSELENDGLLLHKRVAQAPRPDRKVFQVTDAGIRALDAWLALPVEAAPRRDPLLVKLFFANRLSPAALRALLQAELDALEAELGTFSGFVAQMAAHAGGVDQAQKAAMAGPLMTLTNGVQLGGAYRTWLRDLLRSEARGELTVEHLLARLQPDGGDGEGAIASSDPPTNLTK